MLKQDNGYAGQLLIFSGNAQADPETSLVTIVFDCTRHHARFIVGLTIEYDITSPTFAVTLLTKLMLVEIAISVSKQPKMIS